MGMIQDSLKRLGLRWAIHDEDFRPQLRALLTNEKLNIFILTARMIGKGELRYGTTSAIQEINKIRKPLKEIVLCKNDRDTVRDILLTPYVYEKTKNVAVIPLEILLDTAKDIVYPD